MKKTLSILGVMLLILMLGCGEAAPSDSPPNDQEQNEEDIGPEQTFKEKAEQNAELHPATAGKILYTKGDNRFTGVDYYFKGVIIQFSTIENSVGDPSVWMVRNEHGYVMPIQHSYFEAEVGDTVEVWGTLSGNGYANPPGVDNVVGQTGSMHAMLVTVNGEPQY